MPSEQPPSQKIHPAHSGAVEKGHSTSITGGVRGLLGLPIRESKSLTTSTVTATPRAPYAEQFLLPAEENDAGVREETLEERVSEHGSDLVRHLPQQPISAFPPHQVTPPRPASPSASRTDASLPEVRREAQEDGPVTPDEIPAGQREQTSFMIPGRSMRRIEFPALAQTSDPTTVAPQGEAPQPRPDTDMRLQAPASLLATREATLSESELLSRIEQLVNDDAKARPHPDTPRPLAASRSAAGMESMNAYGKSGDADGPQQLAQLQRAVNELTATVLSQATWIRAEEQGRWRERKTPTPRKVAVPRGEARSATPRAFWERSRLGRLHLRTGR